MDTLFDESLVQEFITESREHLDAIEPDLLLLEEQGQAVAGEIVHRVFRAIHSIKGGAGFLAYDSLKHLSHKMEGVLMRVRDGELPISAHVMDVLLRSVDILRVMLSDLTQSERVPCASELEELETFMHDTIAEEAAPDVAAETHQPSALTNFAWGDSQLQTLLAKTSPLYFVTIHPAEDIHGAEKSVESFLANLESLGTPVLPQGAKPLRETLAGTSPVELIFGTVLEDDLAASALELPEERVVLLSQDALEELSRAAANGTPVATSIALAAEPAVEVAVDGQDNAAAAVAQAAGKPGARTENAETLRVRIDLLTRLMNSAGELVLARNQLFKSLEGLDGNHGQMAAMLQNMDRVTAEIQESVMQTRLQPVGGVLGKFPRVVRDIARKLNKEIDVDLTGTEVEVDRSVIELISDPLTHIIRNCADHAIEVPAERVAAGKSSCGHIRIMAYHEGGQVIVAVSDDGRGIDPEKIRASAEKKGVITEEQGRRMSAADLVNLIFAPGFSTAEQITDVSGRGVGMDVVRTNIEKLGGTVDVESTVGAGTTVYLRIPLTLAIVPALLVGVESDQFAIPQVSVEEIVWVRAKDVKERIERIQDQDVLRLRDTLLPLVRLADVLGMSRSFIDPVTEESLPDRRALLSDRRGANAPSEAASRAADRRTNWRSDYRIVVVRCGRLRYGIVVDRLFDSEDIVMKPLSSHIKHTRCYSGATITGDGHVITVIDVEGIATLAELNQNHEVQRASENLRNAANARPRQSVVLFRYAAKETFAVPQNALLRLERINLEEMQHLGAEEFVNYRGHSLPVVRLDQRLPVGAYPEDKTHGYLLVPKAPDGGLPRGGVLVSEIVDAIEMDSEMEPSSLRGAGVLGTSVHLGEMVTLLDPAAIVAAGLN